MRNAAAFISGLERSIAPYTAAGLLTVHKATALTSLAKLPGEPSVEASEWELGLTQGSQNLTRRARSVAMKPPPHAPKTRWVSAAR